MVPLVRFLLMPIGAGAIFAVFWTLLLLIVRNFADYQPDKGMEELAGFFAIVWLIGTVWSLLLLIGLWPAIEGRIQCCM